MLGDQSSGAIRNAWQADINVHLEADQTPVLQLGMEHQLLTGASGLLALQALAASRYDIITPVTVAGGASSLWLTALMHGRSGDPPDGSPDVSTIYAGADAATYMASRMLYGGGHEPLKRDALLRPPAALPPAMVHWFAPRAEPGVNAPAETLPLYASERALQENANTVLAPSPQAPPHVIGEKPVNWSAYGAIMFAVIMVLAAVVFSLQP